MAKQLGEVKLLVFGDENGANTVRFKYIVTHSDDTSLTKSATLEIIAPMFNLDTIGDFFDGYVDVIKSNEGIV